MSRKEFHFQERLSENFDHPDWYSATRPSLYFIHYLDEPSTDQAKRIADFAQALKKREPFLFRLISIANTPWERITQVLTDADNALSLGKKYDGTLPKRVRKLVKTREGKLTAMSMDAIFGKSFDSARNAFNLFDQADQRLITKVIGREKDKSGYLYPLSSLRKIALLLAADGVINKNVLDVLSYFYHEHKKEIGLLTNLLTPEEFSVKSGLPEDTRAGDVRKALVKLYGLPWRKICYQRRTGKAIQKLPCLAATLLSLADFRQALTKEVASRDGSLHKRKKDEVIISAAERENLMKELEKKPLPDDYFPLSIFPTGAVESTETDDLEIVMYHREQILELARRRRQKR